MIQGTTMLSNANYEFHAGVYQIVTWYLHRICSHSEYKTPATITNYGLQVGRETQAATTVKYHKIQNKETDHKQNV